jgi:hypothetical protein
LALALVIGIGFRNVFTGTENGFEGTRDVFWLAAHETIAMSCLLPVPLYSDGRKAVHSGFASPDTARVSV